jgi:hypothetical protein
MKNKKTIIFVSLIILLLGCIFLYYSLFLKKTADVDNSQKSNSISLAPPTQSEIDDGQRIKKDSLEEAKRNESTSSSNKTVSMYISAQNVSSSKVDLRVIIEGTHSGTCSLVAKQNDITISRQADVQALATTSTCKGFTLSSSDLSKGSWSYTISGKFDDSTTTAEASGVFTIE